MKFIILSEKEYRNVQERLVKGEKFINENGGFNDASRKYVNFYNVLAEACLIYEIDNNLLTIN